MKVSHHIATRIEGTLSEVMEAEAPAIPSLAEVLDTLKTLALIVSLNPAFQANVLAQAASDEALLILLALDPA